MLPRQPEANILNPLLWLGQQLSDTCFPVGKGVVANFNNNQYQATAIHVAKDCNSRPLVRFNRQWKSMEWRTVVVEEEHDITILETDTILDYKKIPLFCGGPHGLIFGQFGYPLGYPGFKGEVGPSTDHIIEAQGRSNPIVALVVANFTVGGKSNYSASYINAGFSGGAIVFPMGKRDWTIAGIITHYPAVPRPVYRNGRESGDFVMEHTGLVGYTAFSAVERLIKDVGTK